MSTVPSSAAPAWTDPSSPPSCWPDVRGARRDTSAQQVRYEGNFDAPKLRPVNDLRAFDRAGSREPAAHRARPAAPRKGWRTVVDAGRVLLLEPVRLIRRRAQPRPAHRHRRRRLGDLHHRAGIAVQEQLNRYLSVANPASSRGEQTWPVAVRSAEVGSELARWARRNVANPLRGNASRSSAPTGTRCGPHSPSRRCCSTPGTARAAVSLPVVSRPRRRTLRATSRTR